jgi:hypothetical protein
LRLGRGVFLVVGVGLVRIDREAKAVGISSRSLGITVACGGITAGVQASYCASIPTKGSVAIIERGSGPDQHLTITKP